MFEKECLTFLLAFTFGLFNGYLSQVILNRNQLATWVPNYATTTSIDLNNKASITYIDTRTFDNLPNLKTLILFWNKIPYIDPATFNSLINLTT